MEENISQDQIVGHQNQAKKPWFKIVLFTVLGLVLVGGLVFAVFRIGSQTSPKERACSTEAKICPDGSAVGRTGPNCEFASCPTQAAKDETANWKTYKNTKYGYSIKYPDGWEYLEVPNQTYQSMIDQTWFSDVGWPPPQTGARAPIIIDYSKENPEINYQPEYYDNYKKENITVGDSLSAVKISGYNKEGLMNETIVILPVEGKNYKFLSFLPSFEQEENKNYNTVLNLMLSTFKFLDQAQTDVTTNWKTYINQDFGFSIKYPPHWFFKDKEYLEEGYKMVRLGNFPSLD
ncbi:hypothetical protein FJY90_01135 [Candidatus Gottesmanbacteria bacterium]|nr:hypothetical protein [Candidatus Gottesmanbacteria bacterium]